MFCVLSFFICYIVMPTIFWIEKELKNAKFIQADQFRIGAYAYWKSMNEAAMIMPTNVYGCLPRIENIDISQSALQQLTGIDTKLTEDWIWMLFLLPEIHFLEKKLFKSGQDYGNSFWKSWSKISPMKIMRDHWDQPGTW